MPTRTANRFPWYADHHKENHRTFRYKEKDARQWSHPEEGEVFVFPFYNYWNNILPIASIDRQKREITLAGDASYPIRPGDRYYVRNLLEELDTPGEWYLDRKTETLYFWPPARAGGQGRLCADLAHAHRHRAGHVARDDPRTGRCNVAKGRP